MPYHLVKVSSKPDRFVVATTTTGRVHSLHGLTKAKATAQMKALYVAMKKKH